MNYYSTTVFLHVLTAILGLGPLATLAVVASSSTLVLPVERFVQWLRVVGWSLAAMLVTGGFLVQQTNGALARTGWMRASLGLFVVLAACYGIARRRLRRRPDAMPPVALPQGVRPLLWAMCTLVAAITYLMETKPW